MYVSGVTGKKSWGCFTLFFAIRGPKCGYAKSICRGIWDRLEGRCGRNLRYFKFTYLACGGDVR